MGRRVWLLSAAIVLASGGCATTSPGAGTPPSATSPSPAGCPHVLNLTQADNGATACLALGGALSVSLTGAPGQEWVRPQVVPAQVLTSTPLSYSAPPDTLMWAYTASAAGTADITSSRSACPPPAPGSVACHAIQAFHVTVTVR